nr:DUF4199 domain-containing protein [uncultured Flavobacterium sp.]
MNQTIKSVGIKIGLLLALILSIVNVGIYFYDYSIMASTANGFILLFVIIIFGLIATALAKYKIGGFITFKEAFTPYIITVSIGILISTLVQYLIYSVLDPETGELLKETFRNLYVSEISKSNGTQEEIAASIAEVQKTNPLTFGGLISSAVIRIAMLSVVGILIALTFRNRSEFSSTKQ